MLKAEIQLEQMQRSCDDLHQEHKDLRSQLSLISKTIFQVKWIGVGILLSVISYAFGITEALKALL